MISQKVVTPVKTGVQTVHNHSKTLDFGACPGPDPGSAGMAEKRILRLSARSSLLRYHVFGFYIATQIYFIKRRKMIKDLSQTMGEDCIPFHRVTSYLLTLI
jgi:hypothetical protein